MANPGDLLVVQNDPSVDGEHHIRFFEVEAVRGRPGFEYVGLKQLTFGPGEWSPKAIGDPGDIQKVEFVDADQNGVLDFVAHRPQGKDPMIVWNPNLARPTDKESRYFALAPFGALDSTHDFDTVYHAELKTAVQNELGRSLRLAGIVNIVGHNEHATHSVRMHINLKEDKVQVALVILHLVEREEGRGKTWIKLDSRLVTLPSAQYHQLKFSVQSEAMELIDAFVNHPEHATKKEDVFFRLKGLILGSDDRKKVGS